MFVFRQSDRSSSRVSECRVGYWSSPRRGRKAVATGEAAWRRCRRHRRGTRGMMVKTPDSPGRGGRRDALLPPLPGLWARGLATTGCTWPDCRRTAFHPCLQPAAPPGQKGTKLHDPKNRVNPNFLTAQDCPNGQLIPARILIREPAQTESSDALHLLRKMAADDVPRSHFAQRG